MRVCIANGNKSVHREMRSDIKKCPSRNWDIYRTMGYLLTTFIVVGMLMANTAGTGESACKIGFYRLFTTTLGTEDYLDIVLIEDIHGTAAHATADNGIHSQLMKEIGKESRAMPWIGNALVGKDFPVFGIEDLKRLTMTEVATHHFVLTCYCYFQHY